MFLGPSLSYAQTYQLTSKWGSFGSSNGLFNQPSGIDMQANGTDFFVVDTKNNRIQVFQFDGPFVTTWGSKGLAEGQLSQPTGISVDPSGKIVYVTDTGNDRIQKFDSNGNFISTWGTAGSANGLFDNPTGIAVDPSGKIVYVTDTGNDRIQKFDSNGNFIAKWGSSGKGDGQFKAPVGIKVFKNEIIVVDTKNARIQKFDNNGNFIAKWGSSGSGNGEFRDPFGISISSDGVTYVTDRKNNNIQSFSSISNILGNEAFSTKAVEKNITANMIAQNTPQDVSLSDLPQSLVISDDSGSDNFLSLRAVTANGKLIAAEEDSDFEFDNFEIDDWYPRLIFHFTEKSNFNFVNVKNVLSGQIKSYKSPAEILGKSTYWSNLPLNVETVLPFEHNGINFLIAEIQFSDGISGIYSGTFELDDVLDRSSAKDILDDERRDGSNVKIKQESKLEIDYQDVFWQLAQTLSCKELEGHGFSECV
jgi:DNA-binding beta-propeller fold protein YncE